jgi:internalin A
MELEDLNYLIGKANRNNVTPLCLLFKGPNFLPPYELRGLENLKELDTSSNQLASLPPEISDLKNITILNSRNYLYKMVK